MSNVLMAIDQGTTGTTVLLIDVNEKLNPIVIGRKTVDFPQHYPQPGWVEHDLNEIWESVESAMLGAIQNAESKSEGFQINQIAAIGITNQRETLCAFDRKSGQPLARAIVWQDKRSHPICQRLKDQEEFVRSKTGLVLDPYFSATKMTWFMEESPFVASEIRAGRAVFGTIDTFLLFKLTQGKSFVTEASNASRTLCYNILSGSFDSELLEMFGIPSSDCLPEVLDSAGEFGRTEGLKVLPDGIPISGVLGDQQAALAGQACFSKGDAKCTYGTGAFMLRNIGDTFRLSDCGLITTIAWSLKGKCTYAFEGSAFIAGAAVQFLRDNLGFLKTASESESFSEGYQAAPNLYFVPALAGLGAPYWDPKAQGAFLGMTRGTKKEELVRATLEGIAFIVGDLYASMAKGQMVKDASLRVDGGAAANNLLMQFQADTLGVVVDRPEILETTAMGAALFAGLGCGMYSSIQELENMRKVDRNFSPKIGEEADSRREKNRLGWLRAIKATQIFAGYDD